MKKLLKYLKPYTVQIIFIVLLIFVQTIANLYLPNLNADIINNGVAMGDTDYILRTGGLMLGVSVLLAACSVAAVYDSNIHSLYLQNIVKNLAVPCLAVFFFR